MVISDMATKKRWGFLVLAAVAFAHLSSTDSVFRNCQCKIPGFTSLWDMYSFPLVTFTFYGDVIHQERPILHKLYNQMCNIHVPSLISISETCHHRDKLCVTILLHCCGRDPYPTARSMSENRQHSNSPHFQLFVDQAAFTGNNIMNINDDDDDDGEGLFYGQSKAQTSPCISTVSS